jgi:hypothetical protein
LIHLDRLIFNLSNGRKKERSRLGIGDIYSNAATCLLCNETIKSRNRHDYSVCKCGSLSVDGGGWYLKRGFKTEDSFENKVEYYDDDVVFD